MSSQYPVFHQVLEEQGQGHVTRKKLFLSLEKLLGRPVVTYFTSFHFPVMIQDGDADILEGVLETLDLSNGLALMISSPGGIGLAAERIVNICRSYSRTGEFWAIAPGRAKSAATMVCFGASKIFMSSSSELGPIDPQLTTRGADGAPRRYSICNLVDGYDELFARAARAKGNLEPYLQQLQHYDARDIKEYRDAISLAEDIAIKSLASGMMSGTGPAAIKKKIEVFLSPKTTKAHGRPIYWKDAEKCGLNIEHLDTASQIWSVVHELYIRANNLVSSRAAKSIESKVHAYNVPFNEEV